MAPTRELVQQIAKVCVCVRACVLAACNVHAGKLGVRVCVLLHKGISTLCLLVL